MKYSPSKKEKKEKEAPNKGKTDVWNFKFTKETVINK